MKMENKKIGAECKPLQLTKMMTIKYPNCWDILDGIRNDKRITSDAFDKKRCYIPIGICSTIIMRKKDNELVASHNGAIMSATASWRVHKQIYKFSPEMEEMLINQRHDGDMEIPIEALDNLPYQCIYIKLNNYSRYDGFFCLL